MSDIATDCYKAIALIKKDGWVTGAGGWTGRHGWCLEGVLGAVVGMPFREGMGGHEVALHTVEMRQHPTVKAVVAYLVETEDFRHALHKWNDSHTEKDVVRLLKEVAARHSTFGDMSVRIREAASRATKAMVALIPTATFTASQDKPVSTVEYVVYELAEAPVEPPVEVVESEPLVLV